MDTVLVKIKHGELRGKLQNNYKNRTFYSFFGIPYATPPLGNLRFKPPQPLKPWKGILDVTEEKEGCIAPNTYTRKLEGSEDCLHLNVYTPEVNTGKTKLKPVIVFIHGGAFLIGNTKTEIYGPEFLLTEDVVLVLISYRLGALGWSRLEDGSLGIPGNQGLRDIIMGLNWVQRNIESFSGNPNNVTLFGESTGALLAHILMFVPSCEGLFHKIILHSTLGILHSAFGQNDFMKKLAKRLGHSSESDKDILEFLQKQPIEKIIQRQMIYKSSLIANVERPFYPVFENDDNIEEKITFTDYKERIKKGVDFPGASHSDELCYLFKMSKNPPVEENSYEDKTIQRMVKLWTNFARNGNPNNLDDENALINIEWKPIEKDKLHFINIGDELTVGINPDKEGTDFWDEVFNMKSISKL
nr:esterase FE4-like [Onthophagus taurus]